MKTNNILSINFSKLRHRTGKALFLILPITVLMAMTVVISSQSDNFRAAASEAILGTAEQQNTVIKLEMEVDNSDPRAFFENQDQSYSEFDLAAVSDLDGVDSAQLEVSLPISNVSITDLFEDQDIAVNTLVGLEAPMASLYTTEDFSYTEGEPIPIILNASTFTHTYEDWGGETEITVDRPQPGARQVQQTGENPDSVEEFLNNSPIKSEAITYEESELIGKEITLSVGGFEDLQTYTTGISQDGIVYTKLDEADLAEQEEERGDAIREYWKYDLLNTPIEYTFRVVGVIESDDDFSTYIPSAAAEKVMQDYFQREIDTRKSKAPVETLNAVFNGLSYNGSELETDLFGQIGRNARFGASGVAEFRAGGPGGAQQFSGVSVEFGNTSSYTVPGLVVRIDPDTDEVASMLTKATVFTESVKSSRTIWIKVDDVDNRDDVVAALNEAGYSYQDFSDLEVFGTIDKNLGTVSIGLTIMFIIIGVGVIILTMSKFVSDSKKEIGIFRAMGMTKGTIRFMFVSQAGLYTLVGYLVGLILGIGLAIASAPFVNSWFQDAVISTLGEGFEVVTTVDSSIFTGLSLEPIAIYSVVLLLITLVISLVPANRAAGISPVEAIKGE